ncbi:Calmodulin [Smittium culicis]|uniref:Calmodulin n=1 Tax=Smittium culicis TaxID=133412 RepID=A0A1R1YLF5_9FUNG|nr:Calmodulin [Smittium culicis]
MAPVKDQHRIDVAAAFTKLDTDKDGFLSSQDLEAFFTKHWAGVSATEVRDILAEVGTGGKISKDQFESLFYKHESEHDPEEEYKVAFAKFDADGDKLLSADDIMTALTNMGENLTMEEVQEMIREADVDGTGMLNYEEFVKMIDTM